MIEPANSLVSRFIYRNFHHEPFDPSGNIEIETGKPLSSSNQALPYIYFEKNADRFEADFPELKIRKVEYHTPLMYILSGGLSCSNMLPYSMYGLARTAEKILSPFNRQTGMFCRVEIEKI